MTTPKISRRGLLGMVAAGAAAAAVPMAAAAPAEAATTPADALLHLLRRATYGLAPALVAEARGLGAAAWLDQQLAPESIDDTACDSLVARYPRLTHSIPQVRAELSMGGWDVMQDLGEATLARATWSRRQLLEVMVEFWSNHLNVTCPSSDVWDCRHRFDADVIRPHALGRFDDMLVASSMHPAMLHFLNNDVSTKQSPNENFGRELLELHTVGVEAGYTEAEMRNSALVMTGCTTDYTTGEFIYRSRWHYTGPVAVLGWSHANVSATGGQAVATEYLRFLASHRQTALHLARKLATRFIRDDPSDTLIAKIAQAYLDNDTAIIPTLRAVFASVGFAGSVGLKVRRPYEELIATVRALGIGPDASGTTGIQGLYWMVQDIGQAPMAWHAPDGYPDVAVAWQSASGTLGRWNAHLSLAAGWWPDTLTPAVLRDLLPTPLPATWGGVVDALATRLVWRRLSQADRATVLTAVQYTAGAPARSSDEWLGWKLPYLVSLILDLPHHGTR